jgi:hypothetical protein
MRCGDVLNGDPHRLIDGNLTCVASSSVSLRENLTDLTVDVLRSRLPGAILDIKNRSDFTLAQADYDPLSLFTVVYLRFCPVSWHRLSGLMI